jgi:hypothetical protein
VQTSSTRRARATRSAGTTHAVTASVAASTAITPGGAGSRQRVDIGGITVTAGTAVTPRRGHTAGGPAGAGRTTPAVAGHPARSTRAGKSPSTAVAAAATSGIDGFTGRPGTTVTRGTRGPAGTAGAPVTGSRAAAEEHQEAAVPGLATGTALSPCSARPAITGLAAAASRRDRVTTVGPRATGTAGTAGPAPTTSTTEPEHPTSRPAGTAAAAGATDATATATAIRACHHTV